jgi:hypothetical protein
MTHTPPSTPTDDRLGRIVANLDEAVARFRAAADANAAAVATFAAAVEELRPARVRVAETADTIATNRLPVPEWLDCGCHGTQRDHSCGDRETRDDEDERGADRDLLQELQDSLPSPPAVNGLQWESGGWAESAVSALVANGYWFISPAATKPAAFDPGSRWDLTFGIAAGDHGNPADSETDVGSFPTLDLARRFAAQQEADGTLPAGVTA